jgi:hypothetical protein
MFDYDNAITKADKETIMAINKRMVQLNKTLIEYDAQHEQPLPPPKKNSSKKKKLSNSEFP